MTGFLDKLNLRPGEKRLVVVVAFIVFVVLNLWFVVPHYGDHIKAQAELEKARKTLAIFQKETEPKAVGELQKHLADLESQGQSILPSEQSLDLIRIIQNQAAQSGVNITAQSEVTTTASGKTNAFFEEKARMITVVTGEKELVDFLVSLSSTNSMIRVRTMTLKPDQSGTRLQGNITLVASYQRAKPKRPELPAKATPAAPTPRASDAKVAAPPRNFDTNKNKLEAPRPAPVPRELPKKTDSPKKP